MVSKRVMASVLAIAWPCAHAEGPIVYGSLDLGIATVSNVTGKGRVTGEQNGGMSSSRLGFKGAEDISKFSSAQGAGNQPQANDDQTGFILGLRHVF